MNESSSSISSGMASSTSSSATTILIEKIVRTAVTSGFTMALLRFVTFAIRQHFWIHKNNSKSNRKGHGGSNKNVENFWVSLFQLVMDGKRNSKDNERKCCSHCGHCEEEEEGGSDAYHATAYGENDIDSMNVQKNDNDIVKVDEVDDEDDEEMVIYKGSCHCQSIGFSLKAKRNLIAYDCPGKIRYAFLPTNTSDFQIIQNTTNESTEEELLSIYYVSLPSPSSSSSHGNSNKVAAHVFCKICGVFIVRAPDKQCNSIDVNIHCLDTTSTKRYKSKKVLFWNNGFSSGVPIHNTANQQQPHVTSTTPLTSISSATTYDSSTDNNPQTPISSPNPPSSLYNNNTYKTPPPITTRTAHPQDQESCTSSINSNNTSSSGISNGMINHWLIGSSLLQRQPSLSSSSPSVGNHTSTSAMEYNRMLQLQQITNNGIGMGSNRNALDAQQMKYYMKRYLEKKSSTR